MYAPRAQNKTSFQCKYTYSVYNYGSPEEFNIFKEELK